MPCVRFRFLLAEMGECHSCTQQAISLKWIHDSSLILLCQCFAYIRPRLSVWFKFYLLDDISSDFHSQPLQSVSFPAKMPKLQWSWFGTVPTSFAFHGEKECNLPSPLWGYVESKQTVSRAVQLSGQISRHIAKQGNKCLFVFDFIVHSNRYYSVEIALQACSSSEINDKA